MYIRNGQPVSTLFLQFVLLKAENPDWLFCKMFLWAILHLTGLRINTLLNKPVDALIFFMGPLGLWSDLSPWVGSLFYIPSALIIYTVTQMWLGGQRVIWSSEQLNYKSDRDSVMSFTPRSCPHSPSLVYKTLRPKRILSYVHSAMDQHRKNYSPCFFIYAMASQWVGIFFLFVAKDIIFKFAKKYTFLRFASINFLVRVLWSYWIVG